MLCGRKPPTSGVPLLAAFSVKICFAIPYYSARMASAGPARYLDHVPIHRELPRALAERGHTVDVVYLFPHDQEYTEAGVRHYFVAAGRSRHLTRLAARVLGRDPLVFEPALRMAQRVRELRPDVVHFHGLMLTWNLLLLQAVLGRIGPPIVLHYHGGYPPTNPLARQALRAGLHRASRYLFTTRDHAQPFLEAKLITNEQNIVELVETSSHFSPLSQAEARQITGMAGDLVCLWAGRLHPIKDPLTALRAFEMIAAERPGARLFIHYLTGEMEQELRTFVAARPVLDGRVEFRGRAPFEQMQAIYSSADVLLQASLREFSGCAILEAMACGVIPAVTDIPSFRAMTAQGRYGVLFPQGDAVALARGVLAIPPETIPSFKESVREHFVQELSFPAMAAQLEQIYGSLI
jgi:glycosyltransferase involved in cell wall biosynthesis